MNDFIERNYRAMLLKEKQRPFSDDNYIFELKLDGVRCLAYLDGFGEASADDSLSPFTELRNKRNKNVTDIYPELHDIHQCVNANCLLDGELVVLTDGKPDFFALQKRALLSDAFKIRLEMQKSVVQFVAYDILYYDGVDVTEKPLMERKKLLFDVVEEKNGLSLSRHFEYDGELLFSIAKSQDLEGIIAKKKLSSYHSGKRTKDWIKIKNMIDEDLIVCGIEVEERSLKSIILGYFDQNKQLHCRGSVSGISSSDIDFLLEFAETYTTETAWFDGYNGVKWLKLKLVGTVHYMQKTVTGKMRQPIWKGLRLDKTPNECVEYLPID